MRSLLFFCFGLGRILRSVLLSRVLISQVFRCVCVGVSQLGHQRTAVVGLNVTAGGARRENARSHIKD